MLAFPLVFGATVLTAAHCQEAAPYPRPAPPEDDASFGTGIQRTMKLLATSSATRRNTVRVLFYGQSITAQAWTEAVSRWLREQYPHANLIIENRAIGGFAAQFLVKSAESDLYPFYPDLMIFHVYGNHFNYEEIIQRTRQRTTAEILMQTDHVTKPEDLPEEMDAAKLTPKNWSAWMNHAFLPQTASRYGCELLDQRVEWKRYLTDHGLQPSDLLRDQVHLNEHGCYLMAELVKQHLRYLPDHPDTAWRDLAKTYAVGEDVDWEDGRLALPFTGNRIDVIAEEGARPGSPTEVRIDGKRPSEFPGAYAQTRATYYPGTPWPCAMRIGREAPWLLEDWTIRVVDASDDLKSFRFEVIGSQTGPDGKGTGAERFVSNSGRVVIEPDDWSMARSREFTGKPMPERFEVKWKIVPLFVDEYTPPQIKDPAIETTTTLARGIPNGPHTLELIAGADGPPPIRAIRAYRPPM